MVSVAGPRSEQAAERDPARAAWLHKRLQRAQQEPQFSRAFKDLASRLEIIHNND